jgi:hypothetical protein
MTWLGMVILVCLVTLCAAWLVNCMVSILSGDHPRDTGRVWLGILFGELKELGEVLSSIRPRWLRFLVAIAVGFAVFAYLFH